MASKSSPQPPLTPEEFSGIMAAHRQWVDSEGKEGHKAEFTGANLQGLDVSGYELSGLNFREANLARVKFGDALVEGAKLQCADLREADLSRVRGLLAPQLAGANLAGAQLPEDLKEFAGLKHVDAASGHVQKIFFLLLLVCVYCWLTIAVTTDAGLLNNFAETPLPIIGTKINLVMFYWAAPFLLLCVYLYFHLCLQRLWEALAGLPAVFPDGLPLPQRIHPWLWNGLVWAFFPRLRDRRPPLLGLQKLLAILLVWWAGPLTILVLWWRYLPAHDWTITLLQLVVLTMALDGALGFFLLTRATLRLKEGIPFPRRRPWRRFSGMPLVLTIIAIAICFYSLSLSGIDGLWLLKDIQPSAAIVQEDSKESFEPPHSVVIKLAEEIEETRLSKHSNYFSEMLEKLVDGRPLAVANLREAEVSLKPPQWKPGDLGLIRGAFLRGRNLRWADAYAAFLVKADLKKADLYHANLERADLQRANLNEANLQQASLWRANLQHSKLVLANLQQTFLREANFEYANLNAAKLRGALLLMANLQHANLQEADLQHADLREANLQHANLQNSDLQNAKGLNKDQVRATHCWSHAIYSPRMLKILDLPPEHNKNLEARNFAGYKLPLANLQNANFVRFNLRGTNLQGADLQGTWMAEADLTGANLKGANLRGADLREAKGLTREQIKVAIMDEHTQLPHEFKDLIPSKTKKP